MELQKLNFPADFNFEFKQDKDKFFIYDEVRKSWYLLTPEEWVRQHWIHHFIKQKSISASAIILEKKLVINNLTKRIDILITEKALPKILIECKAPHIKLTEKTFEQTARYNSILKAEKIILSNGLQHISVKFIDNQYTFEAFSF
ncbi:type I restriction enzyme HsdR N-terminal domain-containing protein [Halpernia frigidisoli]|uniref:Type I restriction enzyme R protein N terminus (HSDR_N) n=1 Tax=Halpernia frigidisoli TaxID=1125876 RepID=A0A1I3CYW0_9FLAO|nr:type I restriction enzyme HsdR N-terminal domain-containing protein [Halpernia frigidisoli]SFH79740.1 Type I restriction enzyme R protein N terminus (HSDR_N) [Halpernia frigidisoli]